MQGGAYYWGVFFLERSLGHYLEAFYRAIGVMFWREAQYLDIFFFMGAGPYDSDFVRERGIFGVLIISELVAGSYSLSIASGVLSNGAEAKGG